ncbi:hypothetical protein NEIRO03_2395 [Nematocida sp. AWRm78]|nr:hypothetical protein NEIRO02_2380 [Nematocida sp. AWRm79]KAI5186810.1 hypothetical protein NEIRO03_2395 [Nematocida sp. AWRm78]
MENNKLNKTDKNITDETTVIYNEKPLSVSKVDLFVNDSNKESLVCIKSTTETEEDKKNDTNVNVPYEALEVPRNLEDSSKSPDIFTYVNIIIQNFILSWFSTGLMYFLTFMLYSDSNGKVSEEMKIDIGISEFGFSTLTCIHSFSLILYTCIGIYSMWQINNILCQMGNTGTLIMIILMLLSLSLIYIFYSAVMFLAICLFYNETFYLDIVAFILLQLLSIICVYSYNSMSQKAPESKHKTLCAVRSYFKNVFCAIYYLTSIVCIVLCIILAVNRSNWMDIYYSKITADAVANATNSSAPSL